ncbi:hypothetical protein CUMW_142290, partial [Citrus unshiu]
METAAPTQFGDIWQKMGTEEKKAAVQEEVKRMNKLPANSAYASHRLRVLNKILQLMSQPVYNNLLMQLGPLHRKRSWSYFLLDCPCELASPFSGLSYLSKGCICCKLFKVLFPLYINCGHGCVTVVAAIFSAAVARFFNASPDYGCALSLHP